MTAACFLVGLAILACVFGYGARPTTAEPTERQLLVSGGFSCLGIVLVLVSIIVALTGCAQTLPALSSGLDGARQVIAVSCPARTTPCERVLSAYNVGIVAYNNALLAQAVGEDASAFEQQGMAALKQLWAALMQVRP